LIPLVVVLISVLGGVAIWALNLERAELEREIGRSMRSANDLTAILVERDTEILHALIEGIANDPVAMTNFAAGDFDRLLEVERKRLDQDLSQFGVTHYCFIDTDRVARLRLHEPRRRGDRIDRFTLSEAARTGEYASGVEIGPLGTYTLRVVRPAYHGGRLIGYVELGMEFHQIFSHLPAVFDGGVHLLLDADLVARRRIDLSAIAGRAAGTVDRGRRRVLVHSTGVALPVREIEGLIELESDAGPRIAFVESKVDDTVTAVALSPLHDASGASVGSLAVTLDVTRDFVSYNRAIWVVVVACLAVVAGMVLLFWRLTGQLDTQFRRADESGREAQKSLEARVDERTAELLQSEERYRNLINVSPDGVLVHTAGEIVFANAALATMLGAESPEILIGRTIDSFVTRDGRVDAIERRGRPAEREKRSLHETAFSTLDGSTLPVERMSVDIEWQGRASVLVVVRDMTERKIAERELRRSRQQAERANLAKSEFLANMSHEIRTPMNGVIGMAGLLQCTDLSEQQRDYVETIRASGDSLLTIINDILDFSKLEAGKLELEISDFEPAKVVRSVADLLGPQARAKGLDLTVAVAPDLPPRLEGDAGRLRQILLNLVGNAVKFTEHGSVAVAVMPEDERDDDVGARFEVSDTGIGLSEDDQARLFDRFTQADASNNRRHGGTGLGLAIANQLCGLMGGELRVDSAPDRGSTFYFSVRLRKSPSARDESEPDSEGADPGVPPIGTRNLRILVAEDNHVNQLVIVAMLKSAGHMVDVASNGIEAVEAVLCRPYDVFLMDVQMPEMDGIRATRRIREGGGDQSRIPIIAVTANAMQGDREKGFAAGMDDYVTKPIDAAKLYEAIARQCGAVTPMQGATPERPRPEATPAEAQTELAEFLDSLDDRIDATG
jgi:PAS domain S-box-containing protein